MTTKELRDRVERFLDDIKPVPADVYVEFAREIADTQKQLDAELADRMGANAVAAAIRESR